MPTYEYVCRLCDHEFEEFQAMSAKALRRCPQCGKLQLERKIGLGAGVIFKGGGFYETDYRSESYKKSAEADKKSAEPAKKADSPNASCACGKKAATECAGSGPPKTQASPD